MKVYYVHDTENPENDYSAVSRSFWEEGFSLGSFGAFATLLIMEKTTTNTIEEMVDILKGTENEKDHFTREQYRDFLLPMIEKGYLTIKAGE